MFITTWTHQTTTDTTERPGATLSETPAEARYVERILASTWGNDGWTATNIRTETISEYETRTGMTIR